MQLTPFGDITAPCKIDSLAKGEYVTDGSVYYSADRFEGITYATNFRPNPQLIGKGTGESFSFQFGDVYMMIGFFGSYSPTTVHSLGAIRLKTDCAYF